MLSPFSGLDLTGKVAIVTGASSGIGLAAARLLSVRGASLVVNYLHNKSGAADLVGCVRQTGGLAIAFGADVSTEEGAGRLVDAAMTEFGRIDILVNNAGIKTHVGDFMDHTIDVWDAHYRTNVRGPVLMCRAVIPVMVAQHWGRIVNVSSKAARLGNPKNAIYYASSKAALDALTIGLGMEYAGTGVLVNGVAPGITDTPIHLAAPEWFEKRSAAVPLGRAATPAEVAEVIAFLASPANSYMVGETVTVAGGR